MIADDFRCKQEWGPGGYSFEVLDVDSPTNVPYITINASIITNYLKNLNEERDRGKR